MSSNRGNSFANGAGGAGNSMNNGSGPWSWARGYQAPPPVTCWDFMEPDGCS